MRLWPCVGIWHTRARIVSQRNGSAPLQGGVAIVLGWLVVALANAVMITTKPLPPAGIGVRLQHHLFDLGQLLAIALACAGFVAVWRRWGSRRNVLACVCIGLLAVLAACAVVPDDLESFSYRLFPDHERDVQVLGAVVLGAAVGVAAFVGSRLRRPRLRWLGIGLGAAAAAMNHVVLERGYPAAHLFLACAAATLAGSSIVGSRGWSWPRSLRIGATVVALAAAGAALLVTPDPRAAMELFKSDGAVLVRYVAIARSWVRSTVRGPRNVVLVKGIHPDWNKRRDGVASIAPTEPRLTAASPVFVLITVDALRNDLLTNESYRRRLPNLWKLASDGVYFTQMRTAGSTTRNSTGALMASKYRFQLNWTRQRRKGNNLSLDPTPQFPEILRGLGYDTVNVVSYPPLQSSSGIVREMEENLFAPPAKEHPFALADKLMDLAIPRLRTHGDRPLLVFMHLMDAHDPYDSAGEFDSDWEGYVHEVAAVDEQIGRLRRAIEDSSLRDRTILILTADHGEALGEHGIPHHDVSLYDVLVRVPLVIYMPGVTPRRVNEPVSTTDIGPTILDLAFTDTPGEYMGQSLVMYLRGETPALTRPIVGDQLKARSLVYGKYKLIHNVWQGTREVYNLDTDPDETENLYGLLEGEGERMHDTLDDFFEVHRYRPE